MDDDPEAAEDEKITELSSIAAIFPELIVDPKNPYAASLDISVSPATPLTIIFQNTTDGAPPALPVPPTLTEDGSSSKPVPNTHVEGLPSQITHTDAHDLAHLPPVNLHISLPENYPLQQPPEVTLAANPPWVPKDILQTLRNDCARLWEESGKDQVVYIFIDHLQQAAENAFGLAGGGMEKLPLSSDMKIALLDFDLQRKRDLFNKETFDCGICLEPKKGSDCHRLMLCGHVFCVPCLQNFYNSCITEGDVDSVKCLTPNCGQESEGVNGANPATGRRKRQDRTINPSELLQIPIKQELVQRYVRLKRKKMLESDKNIIYCPRRWCQGAARSKKYPKPIDPFNDTEDLSSELESESTHGLPQEEQKPAEMSLSERLAKYPDTIPPSERLSICEDCSFAFCCVCEKSWHGEWVTCRSKKQSENILEDKATAAASADYIRRYTTPCPACNVPAQKTMGCNHMRCFNCSAHFCYLCGWYLNEENPYTHFNNPDTACYMRLWELEAGDGEHVGPGFERGFHEQDWDEESDDSDETASSVAEDFGDFGGNNLVDFADDREDDESDDEPAPDQRRPNRNNIPMQIELVNAAGQHIIHNLPERPAVVQPPPPPAPAPPIPRNNRPGRGQVANRQRLQANEPHPNRFDDALRRAARRAQNQARQPVPIPRFVPPPAPQAPAREEVLDNDAEDVWNGNFVRAPPAPRQVRTAIQQQAPPVRAVGLERFLELAQRDEEDEWDSDELEELEEIVLEQPRNGRRRGGR